MLEVVIHIFPSLVAMQAGEVVGVTARDVFSIFLIVDERGDLNESFRSKGRALNCDVDAGSRHI